jgi:poly-gamma-glutamate synthesis protein (capsule biosynthesis protein)
MINDITVTALGDCLMYQKLSIFQEPEYKKMVQIIQDSDLAVANLETLLHDYEENAYPSAESGGSWARAPPEMVDELNWLGINIVSLANNHSLDYMYGGLFKTMVHLDNAGIKHAGTGRNLAEARKPTYLETSKGRIGFISASSTFASLGRASPARRDLHGRPGLNPLRYETYYVTPKEQLDQIKTLSTLFEPLKKQNELFGKKFQIGERSQKITKPHNQDMEGNLESIREAKRQSDFIIFSLHTHEGLDFDFDQPAMFAEEFSRACIDEGAHMVLGHGSHIIRGIEIRKNRPIFYSLGNFLYQNFITDIIPAEFYIRFGLDPYSGMPADVFDAREKNHHAYSTKDAVKRWISFLPRIRFEKDRLVEVNIYPIHLGQEKPRSQRGRPMIAIGSKANKILDIVKKLSSKYGTDINIKDGVGEIVL